MKDVVLMMLGMFRTTEWIICAVIAAAVFFAGMGAHKVFADRKIANIRAEHAQQREAWATQSAESQRQARLVEQTLQASVDLAEKKHAQELNSLNARILSLSTSRLRDAAVTYARGTGEDSCAANSQRAETIGDVFGQCGDALAAMAGEAEKLNAEKRALLEAWPSN